MATTICPACDRPAALVDSRGIGWVRVTDEAGLDLGVRRVTERRILCADPETCGGGVEASLIHVVYRLDVYQGTTDKVGIPSQLRCEAMAT